MADSLLPDVTARITPQMGGGGGAEVSLLPAVSGVPIQAQLGGKPVKVRRVRGGQRGDPFTDEDFIKFLNDSYINTIITKTGKKKYILTSLTLQENDYIKFINYIQNSLDDYMKKIKKIILSTKQTIIDDIKDRLLDELYGLQTYLNQFEVYGKTRNDKLKNKGAFSNIFFNLENIKKYKNGVRVLLLSSYIDGSKNFNISYGNHLLKILNCSIVKNNSSSNIKTLCKKIDELIAKEKVPPLPLDKTKTAAASVTPTSTLTSTSTATSASASTTAPAISSTLTPSGPPVPMTTTTTATTPAPTTNTAIAPKTVPATPKNTPTPPVAETINSCYEKLRAEMAKENPDFTGIIQQLYSEIPKEELKNILYDSAHAPVRQLLRQMIELKVNQFKEALSAARGEEASTGTVGTAESEVVAKSTNGSAVSKTDGKAAVSTNGSAVSKTDGKAAVSTNGKAAVSTDEKAAVSTNGTAAVTTSVPSPEKAAGSTNGSTSESAPGTVTGTAAVPTSEKVAVTTSEKVAVPTSEKVAVPTSEKAAGSTNGSTSTLTNSQTGGEAVYYRGIASLGHTCYCAAVLQFLYSMDTFRNNILNYTGNEEPAKSLHIIFDNLNKNFVSTSDNPNPNIRINDEFPKLYCLDSSETGRQQDVAEFLTKCITDKILSNPQLSNLLEFIKTTFKNKIIDPRTNKVVSDTTQSITSGNSYEISILRGLEPLNEVNIQQLYNRAVDETINDYAIKSTDPTTSQNREERITVNKKLFFTNNPEYIIFILTPFEIVNYTTGEQRKKSYNININKSINILFDENNTEINKNYILKGFIEHTGNTVNSGHYTYTQYFSKNDSYVLFNDSIIENRTDNPLENNSKVYVLLYQKDGTENQNYERNLKYWSTTQQSEYVSQLPSNVLKEKIGGAKTRHRRSIRPKKTKRRPRAKK